MLLGAWLDGLRELVEHVGGLVHPTALLARRPVDLAQGFPETERPVAGGQLGRNRQAAALEIEQHFAPGLGALPVAVGDRQQLLAAQLVGTDDHAHALLVMVEPW